MKHSLTHVKPILLTLASMLATPLAAETPAQVDVVTPIAKPASVPASSPWTKDDGEWITISGKVTEAGRDAFKLDYGKGAVTVEMDDYDRQAEGLNIKVDDQVIVTGRVDADKNKKRTIEAGSVYVKNLGKSFFANSDDEEDVFKTVRTAKKPTVMVSGKVTLIEAEAKEMVVETPYQIFGVSTVVLPEDAFDKEGAVQIQVGDVVTVYGIITDGFMTSSSLKATTIVEIKK